MNAYELADALKDDWADKFRFDAADMLRQQADRIDKLEREAVAKNNYLEQHCQKIDQQADRIAELENQSQPVAWTWFSSEENTSLYTQMTGYTTECWSRNKPDESVKVDEGTLIPLYTTPQTKPLSDEEIWNWFKENTALTKESALRIARAIEERHGIK